MRYDLDTFRGDLLGGLTATVVALPVSLGFGIASGMGPAAGLYGAIVVGFFASVFGGTKSQISGPTAPMAVAMAVVVTSHAGTFAEALTVVVLAGLLQIGLGVSRMGRFIAYTPHVVVSGFMSGIGIIVILLQTLPSLGVTIPGAGLPRTFEALPAALDNPNLSALAIAAVTLAVGFLWPRRWRRYVPGPLAALVAGTGLGLTVLTGTPAIGAIPTGLPSLQWELPGGQYLLQALQPALILALLGSVDSLLTSLVADSMTRQRHNPDRELVGQGIGNTIAGLFGALPGAGATIGTVINIRSGGSTPVSGVVRSVVLLAVVLGLGRHFEPIPLAALAGVLAKVGWDIIDWRMLTLLHRLRREQLAIVAATLLLTVFVDLLTAVAVGLIASAVVHARQLESLELDSVMSIPILDQVFFGGDPEMQGDDPFAARVGMVALKGSFTVASASRLVAVIGPEIGDHEVVVFDFAETTRIDDSAAHVIRQLVMIADESGTACVVVGLDGQPASMLDAMHTLRRVPGDRIVATIDDAREVAKGLLG
ncbi:MAG: SulP family inorganic anion transporter [Gemmatimonadetes bacterium]|nr:SulP family inorganic anion transporter [Gemmatimonadota bacterium]MCY3942650.1 SulP family inorganic anion transporter [Gemmatimonadota bacterium]